MWFILLAVIVIACIAAHELGHFAIFRKYGVKVEEICLLGVGPKLLSFKPKWANGAEVTMRLFPIAAFVKPNIEEAIKFNKECTIQQTTELSGIGPIVNFSIAFMFIAAFGNVALLVLTSGLLLILYRWTTHAVLPIGLVMFGVLAYSLSTMPLINPEIGFVTATINLSYKINSIEDVLKYAAGINVALATINCAPLSGTDGGQILDKYLRSFIGDSAASIVFVVTTIVMLFLIAVTVLGDLAALYNWLS